MALLEEIRRAAFVVSASGNQVVQHAEVDVRQQASLSSQAMQASVERYARACCTRIGETATKEGVGEDEVGLEEARTGGYLPGSPGGGGGP